MAGKLSAWVRGEAVVVGQDGELADIDNPQGYIFGTNHIMVIEDEDGYRWEKDLGTDLKAAEECRDMLQADLDRGVDPRSEFVQGRPCYGSLAYEASGQGERDYAEELAEDGPF
jgi:hypothetical protein